MSWQLAGITALVVLLGASALTQEDGDQSLQVKAELASGPHYVGQSVPVRVQVVAEDQRPELIPPEHPEIDLTATGSSIHPITASAIGPFVTNESNAYIFNYVLIPRSSGTFRLPAFRARLDDQSGSSRSLRLDVQTPPAAGRPSDYLGGVGPIEVEARASPDAIRLGQALTWEIQLTGPGARGSTQSLSLANLDQTGLSPEVEPLEPVAVSQPPERTFRFRLRPTQAGRADLPPVSIATFDPDSGRYWTIASNSVPIRVADPPRFDPKAMTKAAPQTSETTAGQWPSDWQTVAIAMGLVVIFGAIAALIVVGRWRRSSRWSQARAFARRQSRRLASTGSVTVRAERIAEALAGYLERAIGRPPGALTPPEVRTGVLQATGRPDLADRAADLLAACDRQRYADQARSSSTTAGLDDATAVFDQLARLTGRKGACVEEPPLFRRTNQR